MRDPATPGAVEDGEAPPIGGSWRALYVAVALNLAALILLFYAFTKAFE
jgi:hypothetical protein